MNKKLSLLVLLSVSVGVHAKDVAKTQEADLKELTQASAVADNTPEKNVQEESVAPLNPTLIDQIAQTLPQLTPEQQAGVTEARKVYLQGLASTVVQQAIRNRSLAGAFDACRELIAEGERSALVTNVQDLLYELVASHARADLTGDEKAVRALLTDFCSEVNARGVDLIQLDGHNVVSRFIAKQPYVAGVASAATIGAVYAAGSLVRHATITAAEETGKASVRAAVSAAARAFVDGAEEAAKAGTKATANIFLTAAGLPEIA